MLTDEDIERAWLGDQTVAPRGGRITGFSRLASFARAIEAITREQTIEECAKVCADIDYCGPYALPPDTKEEK